MLTKKWITVFFTSSNEGTLKVLGQKHIQPKDEPHDTATLNDEVHVII